MSSIKKKTQTNKIGEILPSDGNQTIIYDKIINQTSNRSVNIQMNSTEKVSTTVTQVNNTNQQSKIKLKQNETKQTNKVYQHNSSQETSELETTEIGNITVVTNSETKYKTSYSAMSTIVSSLPYHRNIYNPMKGNQLVKKDDHCIRIAYQNINSLRPKTLDKWKASLDRMKHLEIDVIGMTETSVNWTNNKVRSKYKTSLKTMYPKIY
jgi:hypothetical protein